MQIKTGAAGNAYPCGSPYDCRCRQPGNRIVMAVEDHARTEKPDAADDLRRQAHRIAADIGGDLSVILR